MLLWVNESGIYKIRKTVVMEVVLGLENICCSITYHYSYIGFPYITLFASVLIIFPAHIYSILTLTLSSVIQHIFLQCWISVFIYVRKRRTFITVLAFRYSQKMSEGTVCTECYQTAYIIKSSRINNLDCI